MPSKPLDPSVDQKLTFTLCPVMRPLIPITVLPAIVTVRLEPREAVSEEARSSLDVESLVLNKPFTLKLNTWPVFSVTVAVPVMVLPEVVSPTSDRVQD